MHQIAFTVFGRPIHWYGVCIGIGVLAAFAILQGKRRHARLSSDQVFDVTLIAMIAGFLGARAFYVIQFWSRDFAGKPFWEIFRIDKGGIVFYGGFILALTAVTLYAKRHHLSILRLLDILAPAIAIAHACGRVGCFLQGCCFGKPAAAGFPGTIVYPYGADGAYRYPALDGSCSLPLYPVQLYEAGLNVLLCAVLLIYLNRERKGGRTAGLYLMLYAFIRFTLEFFRGDHTDFFLGLTPSQTIALALMLPLGLGLFLLPEKNPPPDDAQPEPTQADAVTAAEPPATISGKEPRA